jgi:transposase
MILLRELNPESQKLLKRISNSSRSFQVRNRAKCIILTYQGFPQQQLMTFFNISAKTFYNWVTRWERQGFLGLYNQKGRGRKAKLDEKQKEQVKEWIKEEPKNLKKIISKIQQTWKIEVSKDTVKRIIKKLKMVWKRIRRKTSKLPQCWELEEKIPRLLELKEQDKKGEIDLRYFDESGFSLMPNIPYGWQEKRTTTIFKSCQSKRINILGLMNRKNELYYQKYSTVIDGEKVINFLDKFSQKITKPTVIVLDQASIHTSDDLINKLPEWEQKQLNLFWLPPYSPNHNLIEILWRFVKYEWIEINAYDNWKSLLKYLEKVLDNFGTNYVINFA